MPWLETEKIRPKPNVTPTRGMLGFGRDKLTENR